MSATQIYLRTTAELDIDQQTTYRRQLSSGVLRCGRCNTEGTLETVPELPKNRDLLIMCLECQNIWADDPTLAKALNECDRTSNAWVFVRPNRNTLLIKESRIRTLNI